MPYAAAAAAVLGLFSGAGGALLSGNAASMAKKQLEKIRDTPGLDIGGLDKEGIDAYLKNFDGASTASAKTGAADQNALNAILEEAAPGFAAGQKNRTRNASQLAAGQLPQDVEEYLQRSSAARAVGGGYGGTGAHRNLTLRDFGRTSMDAMKQGSDMLSGIATSTPLAKLVSSYQFLGPVGGDLANLRSKERSEMMSYGALAAQSPGKTAVWGNYLQQMGSGLMSVAGGMAGQPGQQI
jgi:hypothetical protein